MNNQIIIAVDAMGGDNSPNKVIEGVSIHSKTSNDVHYKIFGDTNLIIPLVKKLTNLLFQRFGQAKRA